MNQATAAPPRTCGVVGDLHGPILLDPKLPDDDVVDAAVDVAPGVGFPVAREGEGQPRRGRGREGEAKEGSKGQVRER